MRMTQPAKEIFPPHAGSNTSQRPKARALARLHAIIEINQGKA